MADFEDQVHLEDDFEDNNLTDWITPSMLDLAVTNGVAVTSGASRGLAFHNDKIPKSTEQHVQAAVFSSVEGTDKYVGLFARLDDSLTVGSSESSPALGYKLELRYEAASARTLNILKFHRTSPGLDNMLNLAQDLTVADKTVKSSSSDLGVIQDLRLTVTNEDSGVRVRGFLNNDDDLNPTIEVLDLGDSTVGSLTHKAAGFWGMEISNLSIGVDFFEADDKYIIPYEGIHVGRTRKQLLDALKDEISRGGGVPGSLTDAYLNGLVNYAQQEVMKKLGRLSLFTLREDTMTIASTAEDGRTIEMPTHMEAIEELMHSPSRRREHFAMIAPNGINSALMLRTQRNMNGETLIVRYHRRWGELREDTDRCVVPRMFDEVVVLGAARRVARKATDRSWYPTIVAEYSEALAEAKGYLNRQKTQQKTRLRTRSVRGSPYARDLRYVDDPADLWQWP